MPATVESLRSLGGAGDQVRSVIKGPFPSVTRLSARNSRVLKVSGGGRGSSEVRNKGALSKCH